MIFRWRKNGKETCLKIQIERTVEENAPIEIAAAGEEAEHAVKEIEGTEQAKIADRRTSRQQGRHSGPNTRR